MKQNSPKAQLKRDLHRLLRSMDFMSRHPSLKRDTAESQRLAEIYQQLGLAWEFLALQCRHRDGWRKVRDGKSACKVCGCGSQSRAPQSRRRLRRFGQILIEYNSALRWGAKQIQCSALRFQSGPLGRRQSRLKVVR